MVWRDYPVLTKVVEGWLNNEEKGRRRERWIRRNEDNTELRGNHWKISNLLLALKKTDLEPPTIFTNSEYHALAASFRMEEVRYMIKDYCQKNKWRYTEFQFRIVEAAEMDLRKIDLINKEDIDNAYLFLGQRRSKLLIIDGGGLVVNPSCRTVREAIESLKPDEVKIAERIGKEVARQGEWFFIPIRDIRGLEEKLSSSLLYPEESYLRGYKLPHEDRQNMHVTDFGCEEGGNYFVRGNVKHRPKEYLKGITTTGGHRTLNLQTLHQAVQNQGVIREISFGSWD